jgi:DNA-binding transcriptional ArsR family regulator
LSARGRRGAIGIVMRVARSPDPDIASTARLIGDSSRAKMLGALADGRALPAGELARVAGVSRPTASAHLDLLFRAHLLAVEVRGRHHYYRLRDEHVARVLESLATLSRPARALTEGQSDAARALRFARTCYGHLAGTLGVAVTRALCGKGFLSEAGGGYAVNPQGDAWFRRLGIDVESLRRPLTRQCLDWSERRNHLAGPLGVALAKQMLDLAWLARIRESRALRLTERGQRALRSLLQLEI